MPADSSFQSIRRWRLLLSGLVALALTACSAPASSSPTAAPPAAAPPAAATQPAAAPAKVQPVSVRMGWKYAQGGHYSPYFLAKEKGYYQEEGIDPQIGEGNGSGSSTTLVANGSDKFGIEIDAGTMARAVTEGAQVKMVSTIVKRSLTAIMSLEKTGIKKPEDLLNKRIGIPPGSAQAQLWPAFVKANNLDASKISVINLDPNAMATSLLQGQLDAYASQAFAQMPILEAQGAKPSALLFADWGVNTLADGIIVTEKTLKDEPDLVKRFLRATNKGYAYSFEHPDEAIAAGLKSFPTADPKVVRSHLDEVLKEIKAGQTPGKPLGWATNEEWEKTIGILKQYADFSGTAPATTYFTNDFLPER